MEKGTIARTVALAVVLINQVLVMAGWNPLPFSEEQVYEGVTALLTVFASVWAWWKNNSFSEEAKEADKYLKKLRGGGGNESKK